jgi:hypothetical protein
MLTHSRIKHYLAVIPVLALVSGILSSPPAAATPTSEDPGYVIVDVSSAVQVGDRVFYPTGPIDADTVVVIPGPDGSLPGGMTEAQLAAVVAHQIIPISPYTVTGWAAPGGGGYGPISTAANYVIGTSSDTKWGYSFNVNGDVALSGATGVALGFYEGYNGSTFGTWQAWYSLGFVGVGGSSPTTYVPWGTTCAYPKFQAASALASAGQFFA